ncbi:MAG: endonuclease/exonuclease/phosphatase family protein [Solirubrobacterales bacterium]|nr:endonuclease/exonuclease/phosphatase family protein [Solirubrobacterales bacterium]
MSFHPAGLAGSRRATLAVAFALIGALALVLCFSHPAEAKRPHKPKRVNSAKVMTRNLYLGADLAPAINATSTDDFIDKNGQILRDVDTNDFPLRARGLANEIKSVSPDLVGLQEVALWRTGPVDLSAPVTGDFKASTVHVDYLAELMARLNKGKKRYRVVKVQPEFDFEAPADYNGVPGDGTVPGVNSNGEINGRLTMRDVILAKVGAGVRTRNVKGAHYANIYKPLISGIPVNVERGWLSADVKVRKGKWFRFVDTHFEAFGAPEIREAQAKELLAKGGPLRSGRLPAVLVGDLNSDDDTVAGPDRLAYDALKKGGMVERGFSGKMTWGVNAGIITAGAPTDWSQFIDHVMTNRPRAVRTIKAGVTGTKPVNGLWDSDHRGVWANLRIP